MDDRQADARRERIGRIKQQIAEGTYETPQRLEAAVDALLDRWQLDADSPPERSMSRRSPPK
ncbi:MAG: flagellar biosynthesis anti-sigma factor FlgM [Pirellulales bacterium]